MMLAIIFPRIRLHVDSVECQVRICEPSTIRQGSARFTLKFDDAEAKFLAPLIRQTPGVKPLTSTIERWRGIR